MDSLQYLDLISKTLSNRHSTNKINYKFFHNQKRIATAILFLCIYLKQSANCCTFETCFSSPLHFEILRILPINNFIFLLKSMHLLGEMELGKPTSWMQFIIWRLPRVI